MLGLQAVPNPIPVGATVDIPYGFDTCHDEDYTGANSMRNVVAVTLLNGSKGSKTVTTRSDSFVPPSQEDCPVCGNGILEIGHNLSGEQCDDGNTDNGDCCSSTCQFETGPCNEDNACTTNDTCSDGSCQPGAPLNCDDGNACTTDSCNPASGCINSPITECVNGAAAALLRAAITTTTTTARRCAAMGLWSLARCATRRAKTASATITHASSMALQYAALLALEYAALTAPNVLSMGSLTDMQRNVRLSRRQ